MIKDHPDVTGNTPFKFAATRGDIASAGTDSVILSRAIRQNPSRFETSNSYFSIMFRDTKTARDSVMNRRPRCR